MITIAYKQQSKKEP